MTILDIIVPDDKHLLVRNDDDKWIWLIIVALAVLVGCICFIIEHMKKRKIK